MGKNKEKLEKRKGRKIVLPEKFKDMSVEDLKKEMKTLESEIAEVAPKHIDLNTLRKHLQEKGELCPHKTLVKVSKGIYRCTSEGCEEEFRIRL